MTAVTDSLTLKPKGNENTLRVCGVIDLCAGVVLFLFGLALMAVGTWQGVVAFLASLIALSAGMTMTWSRVYVTPRRILVFGLRPHRARKDEIETIDISRSDFGQLMQVVPIVKLKGGRSFKLNPLLVAFGNKRDTPAFRERARGMLPHQQALVEQLRAMLGVGGSDYTEE